MSTTYDPSDPTYLDRADLRQEMDRVFEHCHGCRLCFNLCPSFPTLFGFVDARDGKVHDLTDAEHDKVVDECYQCKLCYLKCPYVPPHEWQLDFPRLMMRVQASRHASGHGSTRDKLADQFLGRTDLLGKVSTRLAPLVNATTGHPGSLPRKVMEKTVGVAADRLLPPYARQRFTTWFRRGRASRPAPADAQERASIFPTCFIEYMDPAIGQDLVKVYERNNIDCAVPSGTRCCGAPWLHQGDVKRFRHLAERNVAALLPDVGSGRKVVVAQPTCAYVMRKDYPQVLESPEAERVAASTVDAAELLMSLHRDEGKTLDTAFGGEVPESVTYHVACHLKAQQIGFKSRDLLKLTGTEVRLANHCSGIDGTWGYRAVNYDLARLVAQPLKAAIEEAGTGTVCGDCHLANGAIRQETGAEPVHPIQVVARAYGIAPEGR